MNKLYTLTFVLVLFALKGQAQFEPSPWTAGSGTYIVPAGVLSVTIECRGGGGGGGGARSSSGGDVAAGGGGGGAYSTTVVDVTPGQSITVLVGSGGAQGSNNGGNGANGGVSSVTYNSVVVAQAAGGAGGGGGTSGVKLGGAGASTGIGTVTFGGNGGNGFIGGSFDFGGGGGGGAGTIANGGNGTTSTGSPVAPPPGGAGGNAGGGNGGNGYQGLGGNGAPGSAPGGGGGGAASYNGAGGSGGAGGAGRVVISYTSCLPSTPGPISGNGTVCEGSSNSYSIDPVSGANAYTWTLPSGWSGMSTTESIVATAGAAGGTISVTAVNGCGSSAAQTISVAVTPLPQVGFDLAQTIVCNDPGQSIVLDTGTPAGGIYSGPGVTGNGFDPSALGAGNYVLTYTYSDASGCTESDTANVEVRVCTSIEDQEGATRIAMYPNPFSNTITLMLDGYFGEGIATVTDVHGKVIERVVFDARGNTATLTMDDLENGVYFMRVAIDGKVVGIKKLFRQG